MIPFKEYEDRAMALAMYPGRGTGDLTYPTLGLCGEAGEVSEKVKKILRDSGGHVSEEASLSIAKEVSDVLWYVTALARELGYSLEEIAEINLAKLESRHARGKLHGSGDDR